jgi:hypothetical protein
VSFTGVRRRRASGPPTARMPSSVRRTHAAGTASRSSRRARRAPPSRSRRSARSFRWGMP